MHARYVSLLIASCSLIFLVPSLLPAGVDLVYQNRGDRYEGIRPKPVSGYDIELISVLVDYQEPVSSLPEKLKLRFYLKEETNVYLTVRELDYKHYYWMDQIRPKNPWKAGYDNTFEWPTQPVLKELDTNMNPYELGVLARLGNQFPSSVEHVAPVVLYHSRSPKEVGGYLFTFKIGGDARLSCSVYNANKKTPEWSMNFRRKLGGRPFTVRWDASNAEPGPYRFVVKGFFLNTNSPLNQSIAFTHQVTPN